LRLERRVQLLAVESVDHTLAPRGGRGARGVPLVGREPQRHAGIIRHVHQRRRQLVVLRQRLGDRVLPRRDAKAAPPHLLMSLHAQFVGR
jgi:hypothetical protein